MIRATAAHLQDQVAALTAVRTTAALDQVTAGAQRHLLPAAFVHPIRDTGGTNMLVNATHQRLDREVGVLLILSVTAADAGDELPDMLEELFTAVRAALVGWAPTDEHLPFTLARGEIVSIGDGTAWWLETYRTQSHLRSV